jgi:hypothetical protein
MSLSTRVATGVFTAAFACISVTAAAQAGGSTADQAGQPSGQTQQQPTAQQQATRQHLAAAQQALAELTKLPQAATLQGEQRELVAGFISDFNAFATATTDWRTKYKTASASLDKALAAAGAADSGGASPAAPGSSTTPPAPGSTPPAPGSTAPATPGAAEGGGAWDPAIVGKLQEVRKNLDAFEESSGDPVLLLDKIDEILDSAQGGNLTPDQMTQLRQYLGKIRAAASR